MALEIYEDDDLTLVDDLPFTGLEAGVDSDVLTVHVWNNKGNDAGQTEGNVRLKLEVEHPDTPDLFVATGFPPVDELWGLMRVVGYDNTGDPSWSAADTDWKNVGAYSDLLVGDIPTNCALYLEIKQHPPSSAVRKFWRWALGYYSNVYALAVPQAVALLDRGIYHGVGDYAHSGLVRGADVTASGSPDDEVHVSAAQVVWGGILYGAVATAITLNQNDSAAAALTAGQSYYAGITWGAAGWHATKGTKAVSPTKPTLPAGEVQARQPWVLVQYDAGGGAIDSADITGDGLYDRFAIVAGSGLQVEMHKGRSIGGGTERYSSEKQLLPLSASDTFYVWQLASGLPEKTTDETPPETTAIGPIAEVDTDLSGVTAIRDRRSYAGKSTTLVLSGAISGGAPAAIADRMIEDERLFLEIVSVRIPTNGGGASGSTVFEVKKNGTTIYTGSGTDDQRATFAFNASTLVHRSGIPEVLEFRRGDIVSFLTHAHPVGGTPASAECHLVFRVP